MHPLSLIPMVIALLILGHPGLNPNAFAQSTPITITNITSLDFGYCDAIPNTTYIVLPAAAPGAGACQGSGAARFDITGDPNFNTKVTITNRPDIINSTEKLTVTLTNSIGAARLCLGPTGTVTVYVGGHVKIPPGGLTTTGLFSGSPTMSLAYKWGSC